MTSSEMRDGIAHKNMNERLALLHSVVFKWFQEFYKYSFSNPILDCIVNKHVDMYLVLYSKRNVQKYRQRKTKHSITWSMCVSWVIHFGSKKNSTKTWTDLKICHETKTFTSKLYIIQPKKWDFTFPIMSLHLTTNTHNISSSSSPLINSRDTLMSPAWRNIETAPIFPQIPSSSSSLSYPAGW